MKYLFSLLMFISVLSNAQTARVGVDPCFQLSDSLGTAVSSTRGFTPYEFGSYVEQFYYIPSKADVGYYYVLSSFFLIFLILFIS